MKFPIASLAPLALLAAEPAHHWPLNETESSGLVLRGLAQPASGVEGRSLALDGRSILEIRDSANLTHGDAGFTFTIWVNPYRVGPDQQMIAAKNRYPLNEREWGVMVDRDGLFRLYGRQQDWQTVAHDEPPKPGHWHLVGVTSDTKAMTLWVNGKVAGSIALEKPLPKTAAPLTFGGVNDNGRTWQNLLGALDGARLYNRTLSPKEMGALYRPVTSTHATPKPPQHARLWDENLPFPKTAEIEALPDVAIHVLKKWEPKTDGYHWLHGVGLAWHKGRLYASFGHNTGGENTLTEEGRYTVSEDGGTTWSKPKTIDVGTEAKDLAVSHGVFLSHEDTLWAFLGAFHGSRKRVHTRAYTLDESTGAWTRHGVVVPDGFWPMQEPVKMEDGNWILPGFIVGQGYPAAVAISEGDNLTQWRRVVIPRRPEVKNMWGESSIIVDGHRVLNIARYGARALALVATSEDFGKTWSPSMESNLPMATSKPASGMLSTGQRYLVCSTTADGGARRSPLTIAVSRPGKATFSRVFVIRPAEYPGGPGESHPRAGLSYPYTIEHNGKLYIGYSNNGGRGGNQNSAELAVVPVTSLAVTGRE